MIWSVEAGEGTNGTIKNGAIIFGCHWDLFWDLDSVELSSTVLLLIDVHSFAARWGGKSIIFSHFYADSLELNKEAVSKTKKLTSPGDDEAQDTFLNGELSLLKYNNLLWHNFWALTFQVVCSRSRSPRLFVWAQHNRWLQSSGRVTIGWIYVVRGGGERLARDDDDKNWKHKSSTCAPKTRCGGKVGNSLRQIHHEDVGCQVGELQDLLFYFLLVLSSLHPHSSCW